MTTSIMPKTTELSQSGMALIVLTFILGMAATAFLLHALNANTMKMARDKKTAAALVEAKAALIGRAVSDDNRPGSLPCPDGNGDGSADLFAGVNCPAYVGRFPWKTLAMTKLADGSGEPLWYALASNYRDHATAQPINGTAIGDLRVDGSGDIVAILFSPGAPSQTQSGRPSNNVSDYLEGENADGDTNFSRQTGNGQNDRLLTISRQELMATLSQRMLREIRGDTTQGMRKYYSNATVYPYADFDGDGNADAGQFAGRPSHQAGLDSLYFNSATFNLLQNNDWFSRINYSIASDRRTAWLELNGKTLAVAP